MQYFFSTHYDSGNENGVCSTGTRFDDGKWHWVEIYGGNDPQKYSLRFETGQFFEETDVNEGWMRDNEAFFVGRGGNADFDGYVKDAIAYNRYVPSQEASTIYAYLNSLLDLGNSEFEITYRLGGRDLHSDSICRIK